MLQSIQRADLALYTSMTNRRCAAQIATIARWISKTGDGHLYIVLGCFALTLDGEHGLSYFLAALTAFGIELPLYWMLKNCFKRNRPCQVMQALPAFIKPSDEFSLPSGHTAAAFLMATETSCFYPEWTLLLYVWASLVGASRILLRVHFPTDIICGYLLGSSAAWFSLQFWI